MEPVFYKKHGCSMEFLRETIVEIIRYISNVLKDRCKIFSRVSFDILENNYSRNFEK